MRFRRLTGLLIIILVISSSALILAPQAKATPYIIHGQVTWNNGSAPVAGATVTIKNMNRDPTVYKKSVKTDENGYYSITVGVNEPGDFANESETINITVSYTTSKGEVIHAYADPIVVGSSQETSHNFNKEIDFSMTPVAEDSGGSGAYLLPLGLLFLIVVVLAAVFIILRNRKKGDDEFITSRNRKKGR